MIINENYKIFTFAIKYYFRFYDEDKNRFTLILTQF